MREQLLQLLADWGLEGDVAAVVARILLFTAAVVVAVIANFIARRLILEGIKALITRTKNEWDDAFLNKNVFDRLSQIAPALVIQGATPIIFEDDPRMTALFTRLCMAWIALVGVRVIGAFLDAVVEIYQRFEVAKDRPIRSYVQIVKIITWVIGGIFMIAALMDRSPMVLLSGLGAMTAIIMLVFKDTILGFVASIQLTANDMVRKGDWIEMPKFGADGNILDVTVNTVKVQNWDMTISTIPTYALVTESFRNWRGMSEAGGRRICRAINIDMNTVRFLSEDELEHLGRSRVVGEYVKARDEEIRSHNETLEGDAVDPLDGRGQTNLGVFRAYLKHYLRRHPSINQEMTLLVRHLAPTPKGLPIQIYIFSSNKVWIEYEGIMSDIFDHILAVLPEFRLRPFQEPSGADFASLSATRP